MSLYDLIPTMAIRVDVIEVSDTNTRCFACDRVTPQGAGRPLHVLRRGDVQLAVFCDVCIWQLKAAL